MIQDEQDIQPIDDEEEDLQNIQLEPVEQPIPVTTQDTQVPDIEQPEPITQPEESTAEPVPEYDQQLTAQDIAPDDPDIIDAIKTVESGHNPKAVGPKTKYGQAKGVMQMLDATFYDYAEPGEDIFDEEANTKAGTKHITRLYNKFKDMKLALAAYNWGERNLSKALNRHNVDSWEELQPYIKDYNPETADYVDKVLGEYGKKKPNAETRDEYPELEPYRQVSKYDLLKERYDITSPENTPSARYIQPKIGTAKEFAKAIYPIMSDADYLSLSFNEKLNVLSRTYRKGYWDEGTDKLVSQLADSLYDGARSDEAPDIAGIVMGITGPPPKIDVGDVASTEKQLVDWQQNTLKTLRDSGLPPPLLGSQLNSYLKEATQVELDAATDRSRSTAGLVANRTANLTRDLAKGAAITFTNPVAAAARYGVGAVSAKAGQKVGDAIASLPDTIFGQPIRDYLWDTDETGRVRLDKNGNPIPHITSQIAQCVGMVGTFMMGGGALKLLMAPSKIMASMGGVGTLTAMEFGYKESEAEGGALDQNLTAGLLNAPIGALQSFGTYAVVAKAPPALMGLSTLNRAKVLGPWLAANMGKESLLMTGQQYGQSAAVGEVLGRDVQSAEKLGTAAISGTFGSVVAKGLEARGAWKSTNRIMQASTAYADAQQQRRAAALATAPKQIEYKGKTTKQLLLSAPEGEAPLAALPAPESGQERLGLPAPVFGPEDSIPLGGRLPVSPDVAKEVGTKLQDFQDSDATALTLTAEQARAITPDILEPLHMDSVLDTSGIMHLTKRHTYRDRDGETLDGVNKGIDSAVSFLKMSPSSEGFTKLIERRAAVKEQLDAETGKYSDNITELTKTRRDLQRKVDNAKLAKEDAEIKKDRELAGIAREDLLTAEQQLLDFDNQHSKHYENWKPIAELSDELDTINTQLKAASDLGVPYANNISKAQANLDALVKKRAVLEQQQREQEQQQLAETNLTNENFAKQTERRAKLDSLGLRGVSLTRDLTENVKVAGHNIKRVNGKYYVIDANGDIVGKDFKFFYDANKFATDRADFLSKNTKRQFVLRDDSTKKPQRLGDAVKLDERSAEARAKADMESSAIKAANDKKVAELRAKELKEGIATAKQSDKARRLAERRAARATKTAKKGRKPIATSRVVTQEGETLNKPLYTEEEVATAAASGETVERVLPITAMSQDRLTKSKARKPLTSNYTSDTVFTRQGTEVVRPKTLFKAGQKLLNSFEKATKVFFGGVMPKHVLGYLSPLRGFIKVGRFDDLSTFNHELMHVVDQTTIGNWNDHAVPDYSHIPESVLAAVRDMAETYYGRDITDSLLKTKEGFSMFFEHYTTGQPVRKEVLAWYHDTYSKTHPEVYKALENLKQITHAYLDQSSSSQIGSTLEKPPGRWQRVKDAFTGRSATEEALNRFIAVWNTSKEQVTTLNTRTKGAYDALVLNRRRSRDIISSWVRATPVDVYGQLVNTMNLKDILSLVENKADIFDRYTLAQSRQAQRSQQRDPGGNITDDADFIAKVQRDHPEVVLASKKLFEWEDALNEEIKKVGPTARYAIELEQANNMKATGTTHGYYLPTQRAGHAGFSSAKKKTGSTRPNIIPITNIEAVYAGRLEMAFKSDAQRRLVEEATSGAPSVAGLYVREVTGGERIGLVAELANRRSKLYKDVEGDSRTLDALTAYALPDFEGVTNTNYKSLAVIDGNKIRFFEVDPAIIRAYDNSISPILSSWWAKPVIGSANLFRTTATTLRAAFQIKNTGFRDPMSAYEWIQHEGIPGADLMKIYYYQMQEIINGAKYLTAGKENTYYGLAMRLGLGHAGRFGVENDLLYTPRTDYKSKYSQFLGTTLNKIIAFGNLLENSTRVAAMRIMDEKLGIRDPNAQVADDILPLVTLERIRAFKYSTANFDIQGRLAREVNMVDPFLTANIVELARIPGNIKRNPMKMATLASLYLTYGLVHALANKDDSAYSELDPKAKMDNIWFRWNVEGIEKLMYTPLAKFPAMFWGMGQAIGNAFTEDPKLRPSPVELANAYFWSNVSPVKSLSDLMTVPGRTAWRWQGNYDPFYRKNIVPPNLQYANPADQWNEASTELAKKVGSLINVSPLKIDFAIRSMAPVVQDALQFSDKVLGYKKAKENQSLNFFINALSRSGSADAIVDRSQRLFTEELLKFRANQSKESPEEATVRKNLNKINENISYMKTVMYANLDQETRDKLRRSVKNELHRGLSIATGKVSTTVSTSPLKTEAQRIRKQKAEAKRKSLVGDKEIDAPLPGLVE